ncbi:hypothetical protein HJFPF1_04569 [Paramyrothecium foliicola]|nr:hypothetical protein HJFPF1_04569 [Paramyrothecium foliicola]
MDTPEAQDAIIRGKCLEIGQCIRKLYASGARLWTKDAFIEFETQIQKGTDRHTLTVRRMDGALCETSGPRAFHSSMESTDRFSVLFNKYQDLVNEAENPNRAMKYHCPSETIEMLKNSLLQAYGLSYSHGAYLEPICLTDVKNAWDEARANWLCSPTCQKLKEIFSKAAKFPKATKIVCFGLGSLEFPVDGRGLQRRATSDGLPLRAAMTQHASALTLAKVLGERQNCPPLRVVAQDPAYTTVGKQILRDEGFEVVEGYGSLAFTFVDEESVVISCHPNIPVKQIVADIARPAAMVWNRVTETEREDVEWKVEKFEDGTEYTVSPWTTDEDSLRTRELVNDYIEYSFPEEDERFGDLAIYIRKD